jgi:hypothetical protein
MSAGDWNANPPNGAPMVDVPWLGPFYPPDAAAKGKTPSEPSDVFVAVKRTLGHLGAWPWDPDGYDRSFSNELAHGSSRGPGIEAVQKWAKLDPTGWIGEKTWNFLRSVTIQEGKPHGGEHAFDAYSVELVKAAAKAPPYVEPPEPPKPTSSPRDVALAHMAARLGYTEDPPNSNCDYRTDGIRTSQDHCAGGGTWLRNEPWCGCWCYYALETAGVKGLDSSLASVSQIQTYAKQGAKCFRGWTTDIAKVKPGDLVTMGGAAHVEMVRAKPTSGSTLTYGGNTSAGTSGSQSNGGGAYARTRYPSEVDGYALVRFPGE